MPSFVPPANGVADRPRDLLVSGHVNVDRFLRLRSFPADDRTEPVESQRVELGGTATNIAVSATRYGVATGLVARVGEEFPVRFWNRLQRAHIDLRGVERVREAPTPTAFILEDHRGRQRTLMEQGPMEGGPAREVRRPWLDEYCWVHLTTADPDFQLRLLAEARARGLHAAADPAQEVHYRWDGNRLRKLLGGVELLFGNRSEIARVADLVGASDPEGLLARVPLVVRTEGPGGATAFGRSGTVHVPSVRPRTVRSVVGAGDAFRGGFYAAWFEGEGLEGCLRAGTRAAARWLEGVR
ncbi:MAG: PfkB family carbohydrate kinase [Thermoplasmata archaeon]